MLQAMPLTVVAATTVSDSSSGSGSDSTAADTPVTDPWPVQSSPSDTPVSPSPLITVTPDTGAVTTTDSSTGGSSMSDSGTGR